MLLNITNTSSTPSSYNVFTQVDKGRTIKVGKKPGRNPTKGITFTFQQSSKEEALRVIDGLPKYLEEKVTKDNHYLLLPEDQAIPPELINFSPDKTYLAQNDEKTAKQMNRLS